MPYSASDALNDCNVLAVSDGVIIPTHELLENGQKLEVQTTKNLGKNRGS